MRRMPGPESVRPGNEVLFVDRLQQHHDSPLKDFVLQRGYPDWPLLVPLPFGYVHPLNRGSLVATRLGAVQQISQTLLQVRLILHGCHVVNPSRRVFAGAAVRLAHPIHINEMAQRRESHLRRLSRQLCYPLLFRAHVLRFQCILRVSLQRFRNPAPYFPSLDRLPRDRFACVISTMEVLRLPAYRRRGLRNLLARGYHARASDFRSGSSVTRTDPAWALFCPGLPVPGTSCMERTGSPKFPGNPHCASAAFSDPAGRTRQAVATRPCRPDHFQNLDSRDIDVEAQSRGLRARCLRFLGSASLHGQGSLPAVGHTLPGRLGYLPGSSRMVSSSQDSPRGFLLSQTFLGARKLLDFLGGSSSANKIYNPESVFPLFPEGDIHRSPGQAKRRPG